MEKRIIRIVSDHFGISEEDMKGESVKADIVQARHYAMLILRESGLTYRQIGKLLNKKHETVMNAVANLKNRLILYSSDREIINTIMERISWDGLPEDIYMENDCYGGEEKKFIHPFAHLVGRSTHYQEYIR